VRPGVCDIAGGQSQGASDLNGRDVISASSLHTVPKVLTCLFDPCGAMEPRRSFTQVAWNDTAASGEDSPEGFSAQRSGHRPQTKGASPLQGGVHVRVPAARES
jgi:hypothetical protein